MKRKVSWSQTAKRQLISAATYILQDSLQNAEQLEPRMVTKLDIVAARPYSCPPDKYKINNDGTVRAFVLFKYRVTYQVETHRIRVLRIRHSKMKIKYF